MTSAGTCPHIINMENQPLLQAVEEFLADVQMADSAFGRMVVNDWAFVRDLRNGRRLWPETEAKVRDFMAGYERTPTRTEAAA